MSIFDGLLIFFTVLFIYFLIIIFLKNKGILEKYNISPYGPALLLRTTKGRKFLKKLASKNRFWKAFGSFGIVFCLVLMIILTLFFIWNFTMLFQLTPEIREILPGPEAALILPGINPILPLEYIGYIILALAIAIIVHEFSHGILAFAGKLKVKSLGLLYLIIPIGAFVEPDEEELKKTTISKRMRVYAAGPLSNFVVAFITLLLFSFVFMSAVQPADGAHIFNVVDDTPADKIGLSKGIVVISVNDTEISDVYDFYYVLENTSAYQKVNISYFKQGTIYKTNVTLANKYDFVQNESFVNKSFLGVGFNPYKGYIKSLKNPFTHYFPNSFILLYSIPIFGYVTGYNPIAVPFTDSYQITGPLGALPSGIFWIFVSALYWIFWLNLAVGLFNVLPMIPLDGGFLFNDILRSFITRVKKDIPDEKRDKIVKNISLVVSLTILFLAVFPFFFRYF
jgi:membrane-associated protease RseP (regulator of RpoE activity)